VTVMPHYCCRLRSDDVISRCPLFTDVYQQLSDDKRWQ